MNGPDSTGGRGRSRDAEQEWAEFERLLAAETSRRAQPDVLSTLKADALPEAAAQLPADAAAPRDTERGPARAREARGRRWRRRVGLDTWWRRSPRIWVVAALAFGLGFAASRALQGSGGAPRPASDGVAGQALRGVDQTGPSEDQATPALKLDRNPAALAPHVGPPAGAAATQRAGVRTVSGSARKR